MAVSDRGCPLLFLLTVSFILEGIPAVLVGILVYFYLPDYPETAKFLTEEERAFAVERMGPYAPKGMFSCMLSSLTGQEPTSILTKRTSSTPSNPGNSGSLRESTDYRYGSRRR